MKKLRIFWILALFVCLMPVCPAIAEENTAIYRLYSSGSGEHFYTADANEQKHLIAVGWQDEGVGWYAPEEGDPVYRLYNPVGREHHYTMNGTEKNRLVSAGWRYEGISWYSDPEKRVPLYRQYNPHARANNHNYTANNAEKKKLLSLGWKDEGIGWYGTKAGTVKQTGTPVQSHGRLSVKNGTLTDAYGKAYRLTGVSTHGLQWYPQYVNAEAFRTLRDDWGVNVIRLACYPKEGGYLEGAQAKMDQVIQRGVSAAQQLGMYVILDWHVLNYNPNETKAQAESFFAGYAAKYKNVPNVLFEIANEPVNTPWHELYGYGTDAVRVIRRAGSSAVVIMGTNTWSQDIDAVGNERIADGNVMYAFHFYCASHGQSLMNKLSAAVRAGMPVFVSEFGLCEASGSGRYDFDSAEKWLNLLKQYNISYCAWSLCNKAESASLISSGCAKTSGWSVSELSAGGRWLRNRIRSDTGTAGSYTPEQKTVADTVQAEVSTVNRWDSGEQVSVTMKSQSTSANGWTCAFDLDGEIENIWNGQILRHTGNHYVIGNMDYNKTIDENGTSFGCIVSLNGRTGKMANIQAEARS